MMKRILYLLILTICLAGAKALAAANLSGQWNVLPTTGDVKNIVEAGDRTYFQFGPSLFSVSNDGELYAYDATNKLNDHSITGIWRNADGRYLVIAYENGNIDMLHDDGTVVNLAEIKDAVLNGSHRINDVAFGNGRIFVATDFGLVVYDESKHIVIESGIYNQRIDNVMSIGDRLVIFSDHAVLVAPCEIRHNTLDKFSRAGTAWASALVPVGESRYLFIHTDGPVYLVEIDAQNVRTQPRILDTGGFPGTSIGRSSDGAFFTYDDKLCFVSAKDGSLSTVTLPQGYELPVHAATGLSSVWATSDEGLTQFDLSGDKPSVLTQGFKPEGIGTDMPAWMQWTSDGSRLYVGNIGVSFNVAGAIDDGYDNIAGISFIENGDISDATPRKVEMNHAEFIRRQQKNGTTRIVGAPGRFCIDPDDNGTIYLPTRIAGMFVIKDGKILNCINQENSPVISSYFGDNSPVSNIVYAGIDQAGNLWMVENYGDYAGTRTMKVLPVAKRKGKIDKVTKEDWTTFELPKTFDKGFRDFQVLFCKKSNINFIFYGEYDKGIIVMDNNGTPSNFRDDKLYHHQRINDTGSMNTHRILCAAEDADGKVWVGTELGVFIIDDPKAAAAPDMSVRRPIVPRNDGTNLGDYLLSTEKVYCIATDPTNRKWIATENSGIYLVSADGTEILQNFTTSNSPLPDNCVYSVACDMSSNKVYIGSAGATLVYDSDSSPSAADYSEIYAYPNPVRPDYTGWITVTGLMDGTLVKIADSAGNVFFQGTSEGGMVTWDGCDASGNRVRSGIYFVFASPGSGGGSGAVTKIMVIN